jgi:hypothetical protein
MKPKLECEKKKRLFADTCHSVSKSERTALVCSPIIFFCPKGTEEKGNSELGPVNCLFRDSRHFSPTKFLPVLKGRSTIDLRNYRPS